MDLEFTPDQDELRTSVRAVLARESPISLAREVVEKGSGGDALWQRIVGLDWPALTVPTDCGGMGFGMVELAVLMEECGAAVVPAPLFSTLAMFVPGGGERVATLVAPLCGRARHAGRDRRVGSRGSRNLVGTGTVGRRRLGAQWRQPLRLRR
jgi:hypothetical protein